MTITAVPGSDLANVRAEVDTLRAKIDQYPDERSIPDDLLVSFVDATDRKEALERAAERGQVSQRAREARAALSGGAVTEYRGDGQKVTHRAAQSGWTRQDGRPATVERGQRFGDHPVVQEQAARRAQAERPVIEGHGSLGNLVRSMSTTSGSAIVPTLWSSELIDKARNTAAVLQAGAEIVPMSSKVEQIGRLSGDVTAGFRTEGSTITASDPVFDNVTLTATTLSALVVGSLEFFMDAPNVDEVIGESISRAVALELDLNALYGGLTAGSEVGSTGFNRTLTNPPSPRGILPALLALAPANVLGGAANGTTQTTSTMWNELLQTWFQPQLVNEQPNALLWSPAMALRYANAYDTTGQPLRFPPVLDAATKLTTNQIPSNMTVGTSTTNQSDVFAGDFTKLLIGQRLEFSDPDPGGTIR